MSMNGYVGNMFCRRCSKKNLVTSCVLSRLDYCNSLVMGITERKKRMLLHILFSEHHAINTAHPSYSNFTGFQFLDTSNTKLPVCVTTQSLVPPPLTFLNYCSCTALPALSALHQTHAYSNSDSFSRKTHGVRSFFCFGPHTWNNLPQNVRHYYSPFSSKTNSRHFSSLGILAE